MLAYLGSVPPQVERLDFIAMSSNLTTSPAANLQQEYRLIKGAVPGRLGRSKC